ncbi:MAG: hypothetical protein KF809_05120 [Chloroflexi bacterium]|nr:hypothetical protein [Chloroflexota bacterium]
MARSRLIALVGDAPVVLLEAPGGFGKSTLTHQLASSLDLPLVRAVLVPSTDLTTLLTGLRLAARRAGLPILAEAIDPEDAAASLDDLGARLAAGDGAILAVDDVHLADPDAVVWLADLAERLPPGARLVVAGRRLGRELADLTDRVGAVVLGPDTLRLDRDEAAHMLGLDAGTAGDGRRVDDALLASSGWPAAVALMALGMSVDRPAAVHDPRSVLRALVADMLATAPVRDRQLIAEVAHLPLLSSTVASTVGGEGALDRLLDAGLPIRFRPDGWGEIPDPIRELIPPIPLDRDRERAVATIYADHGELLEAVTLLHAAGDTDGIAVLLETGQRETLLSTGLVALEGIVAALPDEVLVAHPGLIVRLVRAAERHARIRAAWMARAQRLLDGGAVGDGTTDQRATALALDAERAIDLGRAGDLDGGAALADTVIAATGPDDPATLGRAHSIRGLLRLLADPSSTMDDSAAELETAIGLLHAAGERAWEADTWQALGVGCWFARGAHDAAIDSLERALALRPAGDPSRAATLTFLAEVYTHRGRLDDAEAAIREAEAIARRTGDHRGTAYAAWSRARLSAERRDRAGVRSALETMESHPDGWFDGLAGTEALGDAADMLALVGDLERAWAYLARTEERAEGSARPDAALIARCRLETLDRDPATALATLDRLEASAFSDLRDRWLLWLERAACHARLGDRATADEYLAQARQAVAAQGDSERIERREPELLAIAAPGVETSAVPAETIIVLLGRFAVERGGLDASPPAGRPASLVKLLAVRRTVTLDEAIEILWPDSDEDDGRARLRNLLNRIRSASGDVIQRREGALVLAPGVIVDARRFEHEAGVALSAAAGDRVGLARAALTRATGELLPTDHDAEWATALRERLTRLHLALLDLVAGDAVERGDLDDAARVLDVAIGVDPYEEDRYVRLGRVLVRQGRTQAARRVAQRGMDACAELDVEPGDELLALIAELERQAA